MTNKLTNSKGYLIYSPIDRVLYNAVTKRDLVKARAVLKGGANANLQIHMYTALEQKDFFESILVYTIRNWHKQDRLAYLKLVKLLLEYGANPNQHDANGYTPLLRAVRSYSVYANQVVQALLQAGADVNGLCQCTRSDIGGSCGGTALKLTLMLSEEPEFKLVPKIIKTLLKAGAIIPEELANHPKLIE